MGRQASSNVSLVLNMNKKCATDRVVLILKIIEMITAVGVVDILYQNFSKSLHFQKEYKLRQ